MSIEKPSFWDYITTDANGVMNGIREDAPEKEKKAYENFVQKMKELDKEAVRV